MIFVKDVNWHECKWIKASENDKVYSDINEENSYFKGSQLAKVERRFPGKLNMSLYESVKFEAISYNLQSDILSINPLTHSAHMWHILMWLITTCHISLLTAILLYKDAFKRAIICRLFSTKYRPVMFLLCIQQGIIALWPMKNASACDPLIKSCFFRYFLQSMA